MDLIGCVVTGVARVCGCEKPMAVRSCSGGSCSYNPKGDGGDDRMFRSNNKGTEASALKMEEGGR
jgi:hypothetical protein